MALTGSVSMTPAAFIMSCTLMIFATGCGGGPTYVPDITLTRTGPIIDATAEFHSLYPAYDLLSGQETFGLDAPNAKHIEPSELTRQVENEIIKELDAAGVFSRITRFDPHPDLILSGRIYALHEHYGPQIWAPIPDFFPYVGMITKILRLKTHVSTGKVHLIVFVLKPTGEVLGRYTGTSTFKETFNPTNDVPPGTRLNRALSEAVHQVQNAITNDMELRVRVSPGNHDKLKGTVQQRYGDKKDDVISWADSQMNVWLHKTVLQNCPTTEATFKGAPVGWSKSQQMCTMRPVICVMVRKLARQSGGFLMRTVQ
jgi:hypothetical protein